MRQILAQQIKLPNPDISNTTSVAVVGIPNFPFQNIGQILSRAATLVFSFAGLGLLLMLILGGFDFLTSAGDTKKLEQGKQRITYAIVGFIIIFIAFWVVQAVGVVFGLESIGKIFN